MSDGSVQNQNCLGWIGEGLEWPWQQTCHLGEWIISPIGAEGCVGALGEIVLRAISCLVLPIVGLIGLLLMPFAFFFKGMGQCCCVDVDPSQLPHHIISRQQVTYGNSFHRDGDSGTGSFAPMTSLPSQSYGYATNGIAYSNLPSVSSSQNGSYSGAYQYQKTSVPPAETAPTYGSSQYDRTEFYPQTPSAASYNNKGSQVYQPNEARSFASRTDLTPSVFPQQQPSRSLSVAPTHSTHLNTPKPQFCFKADIFIKSAATWGDGFGLIGEENQRHNIPAYLPKITLENGAPLPLDPAGGVIQFQVFFDLDALKKDLTVETLGEYKNSPLNSVISGGATVDIDLPEVLFRGKKDGDKIRLRYEGQLVELTINQSHFSSRQRESFESIFEPIQSAFFKQREKMQPRWISLESPEYKALTSESKEKRYQLGENGAFYKYNSLKGQFELVDNSQCHLKEHLDVIPHNLYVSDDPGKPFHVVLHNCADLANFNVMLNERYLHFHMQTNMWTGMEAIPDAIPCSKSDGWSLSEESVCTIEWTKYFKGLSLEEMKKRLEQMEIVIPGPGMVRFSIPKVLEN